MIKASAPTSHYMHYSCQRSCQTYRAIKTDSEQTWLKKHTQLRFGSITADFFSNKVLAWIIAEITSDGYGSSTLYFPGDIQNNRALKLRGWRRGTKQG
jgi:hypothetical protein